MNYFTKISFPLLLTIFVCATPAHSQDPFSKLKADAKHKNESAVILAEKLSLSVTKVGKDKYEDESVTRKRLQLMDKVAVDLYSDFTFEEGEELTVKVIKPDGREIELDNEDAVEVSEEFSLGSFYRGSNRGKSNEDRIDITASRVDYYKVAVQGLEIGDILEYEYKSSGALLKVNDPHGEMALTRYHVLQSKYPKEYFEMQLKFPEDVYFSYSSLSGAPDFEESGRDSGYVEYEIVMEDIPRQPNEYFNDEDVNAPRVNFALVALIRPVSHYRTLFLVGNYGEPTEQVSEENIKRYMYKVFYYGNQKAQPVRMFKYYGDPDEMRGMNKQEKFIYIWQQYQKVRSRSSLAGSFTYGMHKILKAYDIESEAFLTLSRKYGDLENYIYYNDAAWGIRAKDDAGNWMYGFASSSTSPANISDWPYNVVGKDAYSFKPNKKIDKAELSRISLPNYDPKDHSSQYSLNVSLDKNLDGNFNMKVNSKAKHTGEMHTEMADYVLDFTDSDVIYDNMDKSDRTQRDFVEKMEEIAEEARIKKMEGVLDDDFEVAKYNNFELLARGDEIENLGIEYKQNYVLSDMVKFAGDDYIIVEIGRLITGQLALLEDDLDRKSNVIVDYAKQYEYQINFTIPDGYSLVNFNHLNKQVETAAGTFESSAELKKGKLKVNTLKAYKTNELKVTQWNEMVQFLDVAYQFSQEKLVLVKN